MRTSITASLLAAVLFPVLAAAQTEQCFPTCRDAFVCIAGQCVSKCNPICGAGERCTADGACVPEVSRVAPVAPVVVVAPASFEVERSERPTTSWSRGAAIMGLVFAGALMGGTVMNEAMLPYGDHTLPVRLALTGVGTIMTPIVARGAGSARVIGDARGSVGGRVMGWLLYGAALVSAASQLALGFTEVGHIPYGPFLTQGMSSLSLVCFAIDGFVSASHAQSEADEYDARQQRGLVIAPTFSVSGNSGSVGISARF